MTDQPQNTLQNERLIHAYNRMMERVKLTLDQAEHKTLPLLHDSIEQAKLRAMGLGELSNEEADRVGEYLKRDLQDAGGFLADTGHELRDWLLFDIELIEDRLLDMFSAVADKTRLELLALADRAARASQYHTGEITTLGTLACTDCGELLHFYGTGHIPPCPKCHNTVFVRAGI